jgi:arylsulfatase A-like enzyme
MGSGITATPVVAAVRRPNVVIILTDDQGSGDAGCFRATDLHTPSIDALARCRARVTQFYAVAPVCSPSRAGLGTGRYPLRAGMPENAPSTPGQPGMPTTEVTMAEMFRRAGYATAHVGKWHLGYTPETMALGQGFEISFGHRGGFIDDYSHFIYWRCPNRHDLWRNGVEIHRPGRFFPDLMVEEPTAFLESHRDRPFFLYSAMKTPHYPYQGEPPWLERTSSLAYPRNLYAAFVATLDERIGRLIAKLDELGLREDTIIVFQSDNGHSTEERAHGGGSAGPYRGAKFSPFEGGIRVPALISWPGHIPQGEVRGQLAHVCDWLPTLAEYCGIAPPNPELDGLSLSRVIVSVEAPTPHQVVHWQVGRDAGAQWAVRRGVWKLIGNPRDTSRSDKLTPTEALFLSNLAEDVGEMHIHAGEHPELVQELRQMHEQWLHRVSNPRRKEPMA